MIKILMESQTSMSLNEIVLRINEFDPLALQGKTPKKSLYSIIYRREEKRREAQEPSAFITEKRYGVILYKVNPEFSLSKAGKRIE